jgi:hypothetical protein
VSLIDEALRRAQSAGGAEDRRAGEGWTPPPLPDSRRRRRPLVIAFVAGALAVAIAAVALLLLTGLPAGAGSESNRQSAAPATPAPVVTFLPEIAVGSRAAPVEEPGSARPEGVMPAPARQAVREPFEPRRFPEPDRTAPAEKNPPAAKQKHAPEAPPPQRPEAVADPSSKGASPARPSLRNFTGEAVLPDGSTIALEGIVYSEASPVALINGKVYGLEALILGYRIARIEPDWVELAAVGNEKERIVIDLR